MFALLIFYHLGSLGLYLDKVDPNFQGKKMTRSAPLGVPTIEMSPANKMAHFTCYLSHICISQKTSKWITFCVCYCLYIWVREGCKVLGPDSETKWVIRVITGVADTANKMPHFSSILLCLVMSKLNY